MHSFATTSRPSCNRHQFLPRNQKKDRTSLCFTQPRLIINYTSNSIQADSFTAEINTKQTTLRAITVRADVFDPEGLKSLLNSTEEAFKSPVHI